eukprot:scaffold485018_cov18-Prasinocladus_malaysianus.AAC.1
MCVCLLVLVGRLFLRAQSVANIESEHLISDEAMTDAGCGGRSDQSSRAMANQNFDARWNNAGDDTLASGTRLRVALPALLQARM